VHFLPVTASIVGNLNMSSLGPLPKLGKPGGLSSLGPLPNLGGKEPAASAPSSGVDREAKFESSKFDFPTQRITPKRLGVRWSPPVIGLEYTDAVLDNNARKRLRLFPVDLPPGNEEARKIANALAQKYPLFLDKSIVAPEKLRAIVMKLLANRNKKGKSSPLFYDRDGKPLPVASSSSGKDTPKPAATDFGAPRPSFDSPSAGSRSAAPAEPAAAGGGEVAEEISEEIFMPADEDPQDFNRLSAS